MGSLLAPTGKLLLLPVRVEIPAFMAQRLAASAVLQVLTLDVIPGVAVRIVVMDTGLDRVPR